MPNFSCAKLLFSVATLLLSLTVRAEDGLCQDNEQALFSCTLSQGKYMSLCLNQQNGIQYRFGRKDLLELVYPDTASADNRAFSHGLYNRYRTTYIRVNFINKDYRYTVYYDYRGDEGKDSEEQIDAGVLIHHSQTGIELDRQCKTIETNRLAQIADYTPCSKDGDFACG
jgi:hypothetical protein